MTQQVIEEPKPLVADAFGVDIGPGAGAPESAIKPTPEPAREPSSTPEPAPAPAPEPIYSAAQVEEMRRKFQSDKDREVAAERQRIQQAAYQEQVIQQAQSYLQRVSEEDPDAFVDLLKQPEIASFWGEIAGQQVAAARDQMRQDVAGEAEAAALTRYIASTVKSLTRLPEFKDWTVDKFRQEKLYPADFGNDFEAWVAALVDRVSETRTNSRAGAAAEVIAEARLRERLGMANESGRDQIPLGGSGHSSGTYADRLARGDKIAPEEIDALTSNLMNRR